MGSPRDQRHYEPPSAEALKAEFPGWEIWQGVNGRWYARLPRSSPPVVLERAVDLAELREWLIGWRWKNSGQ